MTEEFFEAPVIEPEEGERVMIVPNRSEKIGGLIAALAKAQGEFTSAVKDVENSAFGKDRTYKYADLAANIAAVRPALSSNGIALLQFNTSNLQQQTATVTTALHFGEQFISVTAEAPAKGRTGFDVQTIGACWTYLRRYTLQALCGLASEDNDAEPLAGVDNKPTQNAPQAQQSAGATVTYAREEQRQQADARFSRSDFLTKAKQYGWGMADIKAYCVKTYKVKLSGDMTDPQMEAALLIFSQKKPADLLTPQPENQDAEPVN